MRAVVVHSLDQTKAALKAADELGVAVVLRSAPGAAAYLGASAFREMVAQAKAAYPGVSVTSVLDCGRDPGLALNALRQGIEVVRIDAPAAVRERIGDIATQLGARLDDDTGDALDLAEETDPLAACRAWLAA